MSISKSIGIFCKLCEQMGDSNSLLYRDSGGVTGQGMRVKCARGHSVDYQQISGWRKQTLPLIEKQPVGSIAQPVWMMPEVISALQSKYPQNFMTTLCSLMTALADGDTIILEGQHVREMRQLQAGNPDAHLIEKGRDVVGMARENSSLRTAVNELQDQLKNVKAQPVGGATGGGGSDHALLLAMAEKLGMTLPGSQPQPTPPPPPLESVDFVEGMDDMYAQPHLGRQPVSHGPDEQRGIPKPQVGRVR